MNSSRRAKQRTLGDRVLVWVTILTLITLIAGVGGTWLSYKPEPGVTDTRTDRLNKTPGLERVESRLTRMEKRLSHILDPYIRMLNNLSGKLDDTQKQLVEHIQNTEQQQATADGIEDRQENGEQQLATAAGIEDRLGNVEQQLATAAGIEDRLGNVEQQLATTAGIEDRLGNVEQQLAAADERMDTMSAMLVTLADDRPGSVPGTGQPAPQATPAMAGSPNTGEARQAASVPVQDKAPELQPALAEPDDSQTEVAETPVEATPEPVPETKPVPAAPVDAGIATGTARGNWVINIASYTNEKIARRKLTQMQQQGIDVELVTAEVKGKTIYRARVFGFASRRDATSAAAEIKSKLGLKETWITKR